MKESDYKLMTRTELIIQCGKLNQQVGKLKAISNKKDALIRSHKNRLKHIRNSIDKVLTHDYGLSRGYRSE